MMSKTRPTVDGVPIYATHTRKRRRRTGTQPVEADICPLSGNTIPAAHANDHIHHLLMDPQYRVNKARELAKYGTTNRSTPKQMVAAILRRSGKKNDDTQARAYDEGVTEKFTVYPRGCKILF